MVAENKVSKQMVKWAAGLADESIVLVEGTVQKSPQVIKSASVGDVEIHVSQVRSRCYQRHDIHWDISCT
jgi:aspartyl-tRNA synthetase